MHIRLAIIDGPANLPTFVPVELQISDGSPGDIPPVVVLKGRMSANRKYASDVAGRTCRSILEIVLKRIIDVSLSYRL